MSQEEKTEELTGWQPYDLDRYAQELVLKYRLEKNVLNESHKMRMAVAYGLERFWGEHLRLKQDKKAENQLKSQYWKDVWDKLAIILKRADIDLPNDDVNSNLRNTTPEEKRRKEKEETEKITAMAKRIWGEITLPEQRISLMVLAQFCEALVWWTQRYKKKENDNN
ncbi:MAG: hypothetical protein HC849_05715 [Oscillatoriales cyanobacterium RU_3_3]|nr:hypothetical protein [Microcoleus sp. SU_5_3]NJM59801.1 hypothetical protein [Oscillatoriales cyanobacterium RU_3_3]NJS10342.1 hypothetical protein [Microcoleus sp. CSU_2_2]